MCLNYLNFLSTRMLLISANLDCLQFCFFPLFQSLVQTPNSLIRLEDWHLEFFSAVQCQYINQYQDLWRSNHCLERTLYWSTSLPTGQSLCLRNINLWLFYVRDRCISEWGLIQTKLRWISLQDLMEYFTAHLPCPCVTSPPPPMCPSTSYVHITYVTGTLLGLQIQYMVLKDKGK